MKSKKYRVAILIVAVAIIAGPLACGSGGSVGRVTPTPTKTPKPTFTATPLPTDTPIPTDTPLPTDTPTPVTPTNTPIVMTATFTPAPTDTATPIPPTATKKPTSKPKPTATKTSIPKPTNTPVPAFEYKAIHQSAYDSKNCGSSGLKGTVYSSSNAPVPGISIAVWTDGWQGTVSNPSGSTGTWDVLLNNKPVAGNWHARAVDPNTCQKVNGAPTASCTGWRSDEIVVTTYADCNTNVQWIVVDFKHN
jgi:hypothetical protein